MRQEDGETVPATLGEYLDLCKAFGGADCRAVEILEDKIVASPRGRDEEVIASDYQMRQLLMPNLVEPRQKAREVPQ